ncbi:MAG: hypothetical protein KAG87_15910 [Marinobacter adhaerens]|nr:hypothetical protein [Marinobacter adhaerens]
MPKSSNQKARHFATVHHARLAAIGMLVMAMNLFWPILLWLFIPYFLIGMVACIPGTKILDREPAPSEGIYGFREWAAFISAWPYLLWLRHTGRD